MPLIALCLAIALVGGALLSVLTISPAERPPRSTPSAVAARRAAPPGQPDHPAGRQRAARRADRAPVRSLVSSAIALVPADCGCGQSLARLADQAHAADARVYFVGARRGERAAERRETARYGDGTAVAAADADGVLAGAYHPTGLTVLLVFSDATAEVRRNLSGDFELND